MTTVAAAGGAVTLPGAGVGRPAWVEVRGGRIVAGGSGAPPPGHDPVEVAGVLVPGFVDLQVNGTGASDLGSGDLEAIDAALTATAAHGVTACLPTLVSRALDAYDPALGPLQQRCAAPVDGATVPLGVHLEGPFLGGRPGAHDRSVLRAADTTWLAGLLDRYPGFVRLVTLAPEADPGLAATQLLARRGVVVAVGHTAASYDDVCAAADAGATMATHVFNGMAPLHHREPGPVGAALDRLVPSAVADLVHVHPAVLRLVARAAPRAVLVSDQVSGSGLTRDGAAYRLPDGTLAGSATPMDAAFANLLRIGIPLAQAVDMAATAPADVLGDRQRGRLSPGRRADLVAVDPVSGAVEGVWIGGRRVR